MSKRSGGKKEMPNLPTQDFVDALAEIWFSINFAAYHMAYVNVYSQSNALRTHKPTLLEQEQELRCYIQTDIIICRSHLAAFFWHLEHLFEGLGIAIIRGKKEYPQAEYFWSHENQLNEIERLAIRQEIKDYRNMCHQNPAIIGAKWSVGGQFLHHFLPTISGHPPSDEIEMNARLKQYFEFAANVWLEFVPGDYKEDFPRDFRFPVTIPYTYGVELPNELKGLPQLEVRIESYLRNKQEVR